MSEQGKITEDPDCCEIWPKIAGRFDWKQYQHDPGMLTMPHIQQDNSDNKWFVNFCPACGKPARNRNMMRERI